MGKLSDRAVKAAKVGYHGDGDGLYLQVTSTKARSWLFRYKRNGKTHWMGLGPDSLVGLAAARDAAIDARRLLRDGIDPIERKRELAAKAAAAAIEPEPAKTFEAAAADYIAAHKAGWKNEKHASQWEATLKNYAYPLFGQNPIDAVSVDDVLKAVQPIWEAKPETASRLRGRIENVLDYAKTRGWRTGENPARWRGHFDHLLPRRAKVSTVKHHAALPWQDLPPVMVKLETAASMSALCLRFLILTASRSGEARGARWDEIDLAAKVWTVHPERMKAAREHRVPLSSAAMTVLKAVRPLKSPEDALVFPGGRKNNPLSDVALSKALAAVASGVTVHGMRSTFRDWAAESTNYPREVAEAALAHANKDKVEAAYRRSDLFAQRARLMQAWAEFTKSPMAKGGKVTTIRRRA